ncbi:MAG: hypothetical protein OEV72_13870, partial [Thermoleophilia bacterium]|nr:hypothetical protein [Thermoleophilia bacterium]
RDAGLLVAAAAGSMHVWFVEQQAGDLGAAERALRSGLDELDRLGDRAYYPTVAVLLADTLARGGAYDEAQRWCAVVRETTAPSDLVNIMIVDAVEGMLLARRGDHHGGERLARRGAALADTIDFWDHKARAYELLAETLELCGKPDEARTTLDKALAVCEAKGDVPGAARVRELLGSLSA